MRSSSSTDPELTRTYAFESPAFEKPTTLGAAILALRLGVLEADEIEPFHRLCLALWNMPGVRVSYGLEAVTVTRVNGTPWSDVDTMVKEAVAEYNRNIQRHRFFAA